MYSTSSERLYASTTYIFTSTCQQDTSPTGFPVPRAMMQAGTTLLSSYEYVGSEVRRAAGEQVCGKVPGFQNKAQGNYTCKTVVLFIKIQVAS